MSHHPIDASREPVDPDALAFARTLAARLRLLERTRLTRAAQRQREQLDRYLTRHAIPAGMLGEGEPMPGHGDGFDDDDAVSEAVDSLRAFGVDNMTRERAARLLGMWRHRTDLTAAQVLAVLDRFEPDEPDSDDPVARAYAAYVAALTGKDRPALCSRCGSRESIGGVSL